MNQKDFLFTFVHGVNIRIDHIHGFLAAAQNNGTTI